MKKIYISGQITGLDYDEAFALFENVEPLLKDNGFEVVNPMKIKHNHDLSWINYMKTDIKALMDCNTIYMLSNWTKSTGADIERRIALDLGYKVIYQ